MSDSPTRTALKRAGRRASVHLVQAMIEALKAVEAVIDEIAGIADRGQNGDDQIVLERIDVE